jgi:hypothetical protein
MKNILLLSFLINTLISFSQPLFDAKRDYVWIFGGTKNNIPITYHTIMNFKADTMSLILKTGEGDNFFQTNASICDTAGNLLFYSNGCVLADSGFQYLNGADTINQGVLWHSHCDWTSFSTDGYVIVNGCWILPVSENKFKVIYVDKIASDTVNYTSGIRFTDVSRNEINGSLNGFNVDSYLYQGAVDPTRRAVVRHGNGRDWWYVNPINYTKKFFSFLIDSTINLHSPVISEISSLPPLKFNTGGQACFSPDGNIYASLDYKNNCLVSNFNRCTGELFNLQVIKPVIGWDTIFGITGIAISPNSKFMYLMTRSIITQYDLQAPNIETTAIVVAVRDSWTQDVNGVQYPPSFYQSQLGPDGKIYVFNAANRFTFHVIESPDLSGVACNVIQHKYFFPELGPVRQPPRFPNFRLGPLAGSPCDTLTVTTYEADHQIKVGLKLQPNPATDYTVADISLSDYNPSQPLFLTLTDGLGRVIRKKQVPPYTPLQRIETGDLSAGLYFVSLCSGSRVLVVRKLVVTRE